LKDGCVQLIAGLYRFVEGPLKFSDVGGVENSRANELNDGEKLFSVLT
jgi:hypothetical protein